MKPATGLAPLLPLFLLGACYVPHGIQMEARDLALPPALPIDCITAAIARVPGVTRVQYSGGNKPSSGYWIYWIQRQQAWLSIGSGRPVEFHNATSVNSGRHSGQRLDKLEPVMFAVGRQLEADCGLALEGLVSITRYRGRWAPNLERYTPAPGATPEARP